MRMLDDILRLIRISSDGASCAVDALVMAPHQDLEELGLARDHARHNLIIREDIQPLQLLSIGH